MKHARKDYDRIQDPAGLIPEDEPVFLLRAKDKFAPKIVRMWAHEVMTETDDEELAQKIHAWADEMEAYQKVHGCKVPDTPNGKLK